MGPTCGHEANMEVFPGLLLAVFLRAAHSQRVSAKQNYEFFRGVCAFVEGP